MDTVLDFGKYKNKTIGEVFKEKNGKNYLIFLSKLEGLNDCIKNILLKV